MFLASVRAQSRTRHGSLKSRRASMDAVDSSPYLYGMYNKILSYLHAMYGNLSYDLYVLYDNLGLEKHSKLHLTLYGSYGYV